MHEPPGWGVNPSPSLARTVLPSLGIFNADTRPIDVDVDIDIVEFIGSPPVPLACCSTVEMGDYGDWCVEVYAKGMTTEQRNELMITVCEWLHRREIGIAGDSSDVSALVAARLMDDAEIDAAVHSHFNRAYAVPKRDGNHWLKTNDE